MGFGLQFSFRLSTTTPYYGVLYYQIKGFSQNHAIFKKLFESNQYIVEMYSVNCIQMMSDGIGTCVANICSEGFVY